MLTAGYRCLWVLLGFWFVKDVSSVAGMEGESSLLLICHVGCCIRVGFSLHFKNKNGNDQGARRK